MITLCVYAHIYIPTRDIELGLISLIAFGLKVLELPQLSLLLVGFYDLSC